MIDILTNSALLIIVGVTVWRVERMLRELKIHMMKWKLYEAELRETMKALGIEPPDLD